MGHHRAEPRGRRRASSETLEVPTTYVGRRIAGRDTSVDSLSTASSTGSGTTTLVSEEVLTPSLGTRIAPRETAVSQFDTAEISRVLAELEPVDQTTSFAEDSTQALPLVPARPQTRAGKRKATRRSAQRTGLKARPTLPVLVGIAAIAVAATGAVGVAGPDRDGSPVTVIGQANALGGNSAESRSNLLESRGDTVSRDSRRDALSATTDKELSEAAEAAAEEREGAIKELAQKAQVQSDKIELNKWVVPLSGYRLTARYGDYGLWATYHTGLDFAAPTGTSIVSVANGTVTSTGYDGAYGNKTVITLEDGTEIWYCHQTTINVSVGDTVRSGETIGSVGSTGNVTGPHLHLEVRPGGGDPVNPFDALSVNGARP